MPGEVLRTVGEIRVAGEHLATLAGALAAVIAIDNGQPLYRRLIAGFRGAIEAGSLRPGDMVPPETEIARQHRISRHTVRQAIGELARDGWFRRERGRGTFVSAPPMWQSLGSFYYFAEQMRARGISFETRVLRRVIGNGSDDVLTRLNLPAGSAVTELSLLRIAAEAPLQIDDITMPADISTALVTADLTHGSVYEVVADAHGILVTRADEEIRPIALSREQARLLGAPAGSPAFQVDRRCYAGDRTIEFRRSVIRGDRYVFKAELPITRDLV